MRYQIVVHLYTGEVVESEPDEFEPAELSLAQESLKTIFTDLTSINMEINGRLRVIPMRSVNYVSMVAEE